MLLSEKKENGQQASKGMGRGILSIETAEINGKSIYILVFRNPIGKTLYQATISALKSKQRRIEEKAMKN